MPIPHRFSAALADRYRIERELGAGGMATVYLAHDIRHDRNVAIKVLRPELSAILGGERFLTEIKTTANLQHPHILSLFDSGEAEGLVFYVMPFVEGESLRDRLNREKQLPVDDAVRITREVADALAYAHDHGIVHRDIKPENILLHGGHALVADFGIALAASRSDGGTRMTETGLSLGTPNYMSPEQAMGEREISPKVDIYALGCVLYEMLAGEPPFTGPTAQAIIARVMTEQPRPLATQRHTVAPQLEAVIHKALEKLPADRFASAPAFSEALANPVAFATASGIGVPPAIAAAQRNWRSRVALPALGVALVMTVLTTWAFLVPAPEAPVAHYALALPAVQTQMFNRQIAIAPDGSSIVFMGNSPAGTFVAQLYIKRRNASDASVLQGTIGAQSIAFSPDSRWIAFGEAGGRLRKLQLDGGAALVVADSAASSVAPAWLDDGTIVYVRGGSRGLMRVPESGGRATEVWPPDSGTVREVRSLPGSRGVLISRCPLASGINNCQERSIWVLDLESRSAKLIAASGVAARYLETGHVLVVRPDGAAFLVPFDLRRLEPRDAVFPAFDSVAVNSNVTALLDISEAGTVIMIRGATGTAAKYNLLWVDRTGRETPVDMGGPISLTTLGNGGWAFSPDGKRLAIGLLSEGNEAIWVKELPSGPLSRITLDSAASFRPHWLPGGRELTYVAAGDIGFEIRRASADGTSAPALVMRDPRNLYEGAITPDGKWIVARTSGGIGRQGRDIIGYRAGDTVAVPLIANPSIDEAAFAVSPNGRWIAYESDETGRREVYVRPFPATNTGKWQVSTAGGMAPLWARNGRELYFVDGARNMIGVGVTEAATPGFGERNVLFTLSPFDYLDDNTYYTPFDVGPDGRFIMARLVGSSADSPPLVLMENWFTELRQKLHRP